MSRARFRAIKDSYVTRIQAASDKVCEDQYVGTLAAFTGRKADFTREDIDNIPDEVAHLIILILESPHVEEYVPPIPVPANGETGRNIRTYLLQILNDPRLVKSEPPLANVDFAKCGVILMNGVQFQCSFGLSPAAVLSGDVFRRSWGEFGEESFKERLAGYVKIRAGSTVVINACTKGCSEGLKDSDIKHLRALVESAICEVLDRNSHVRLAHPSSWRRTQQRNPNFWLRDPK